MRRLLPLLILLIVWGCKSESYEYIKSTYEDGLPQLVQMYKSEDKNVLLKEIHYYPGQKKKMEGSFKNDLRDGTWSYWYANGNLWSRGEYVAGLEKGIKTVWHENGQKYYEGYSDNGDRSGIWKFWDENGNLSKEINYDE